jgi:hypothetical protein
MRTLSLVLILANALYFVWAQLIDVRPSTLDREVPAIANPPARIVLAKEVVKEPDQPPEEESVEVEEPLQDVAPPSVEPLARTAPNEAGGEMLDTLSCSSIGPFPDLPQASQAQAALKQAGYEPRQRIEQGELWVGYWVSVQDLATRAAADRAVETLRANGITDVYLMPGSDPENVLSLGVFSDYQRAQKRADEVKALGLHPRIDDRKREGSVWWIDVDLAEPGQFIDTSILQIGPGRILRLEMHECPEAANG